MTSPNDSIQFALGIKDPRLIFIRAFYRFNHGIKYRIFEFNLSSSQTTCSKCHQACLVKNGHFTTDVKFTTDDASHPVVLRIHKQRLRCKNCHLTYMAQSKIMRKYCHIANKVRTKAIMSLQDDRTLSCIAKDNNISPSTLHRYLDQSRSITPQIKPGLPESLAIDEFRGVHRQLHFIYIDNDGQHGIQTILPDRFKSTIEIFLNYSPAERAKVKNVSMDLNSYYQDIVRRVFPNAQIIIDCFHIIAMLTRALNQHRTQVMKQFKKNSRQYRLLKFNWRLYLTAQDKLSNKHEYYDRHLRQRVTSDERVDLGIQLDPQLTANYYAMQDIMQSLKNRDFDQLAISIYSAERLSSPMTVVINTIKHNLEYVLNASRFNYNNGAIEGTNRIIKQIERTAFGFHSFEII